MTLTHRITSARSLRFLFNFSNADFIGAPLAFLCAAHCFSLPFLTFLLPLSGFGFLLSPDLAWGIAASSFFLGLYSLLHGYFHHHARSRTLLLFLAGFSLLVGSKLPLPLINEEHSVHLLSALGGLCLTAAHFLNWRLSRLKNIACPCSSLKNKTV